MAERKYTPDIQNVERLLRDAGLEVSEAEMQFLERAKGIHQDSFTRVASTFYSSKVMDRALDNHAKALLKYAKASDTYAESISKATWVLAAATIALFIATVILAIVTFLT